MGLDGTGERWWYLIMPKPLKDIAQEPISWSHLPSVFNDRRLCTFFEGLEKKYHVSNEKEFFSKLVNMSTANSEPFHRWVRYREGYSGELVKEIMRRHPLPSSRYFVMDPMCGSGSSLVACGDLGVDALGLDVNGYAVLATNVKCHPFKKSDVARIGSLIESFKLECRGLPRPSTAFAEEIAKYFPPDNFGALISIKEWIDTRLTPGAVADFFNVALLAILEDCSDRKKDGNGLATRPAPVSDIPARFLVQLALMVEDVSSGINPNAICRKAVDCSALDQVSASAAFSTAIGKELGSIIFSPPYANSFDYFESYKLELVFGGFVLAKDLNESRKRLVRNYRITVPKELIHRIEPVEKLCSEIIGRIPQKEFETGTRDGRTRLVPNLLRGYFEDMGKVIQEGYKSLCPGGTMHIVVDQSAYVGVPIATDLIFGYLAEEIGFEVLSITNCRRANTSGQQLKKFPYLKSLLRESIVSLHKPMLPSLAR